MAMTADNGGPDRFRVGDVAHHRVAVTTGGVDLGGDGQGLSLPARPRSTPSSPPAPHATAMPRPTPPLAPVTRTTFGACGTDALHARDRHDRPQSACTTCPVMPGASASKRSRTAPTASSRTEPGNVASGGDGSTTARRRVSRPGVVTASTRTRRGPSERASDRVSASTASAMPDSGAQPAESSGAGRSTTATTTPPSAQRLTAATITTNHSAVGHSARARQSSGDRSRNGVARSAAGHVQTTISRLRRAGLELAAPALEDGCPVPVPRTGQLAGGFRHRHDLRLAQTVRQRPACSDSRFRSA